MLTLIAIHAQLDAWYGMAIAIKKKIQPGVLV
jgi:hypothetical protein